MLLWYRLFFYTWLGRKMNVTSKTGLLASKTKVIHREQKRKPIQLIAVAIPAPVILRPFSDLYNPFPYGCSLLCNHPTDREAKDYLKKARETWAHENKSIILPEEIKAIRDSLAVVEEQQNFDNVPEELFRRYTETDSRPLTPAPTLASVKTRGSGSRRCVTPDPINNDILQERKLLILDLRRSHSQEIISWHGLNDPPLIGVLQPPTPSISIDSPSEFPDTPKSCKKDTPKQRNLLTPSPKNSPRKTQKLDVPKNTLDTLKVSDYPDQSDGEEEIVRRRGKRRKKRGRDSSRGPLAVQASVDPETQISTLGDDHNRSARPSLVPQGSVDDNENKANEANNVNQNNKIYKSILKPDILKHLQRELTYEIVDLEFDKMKRSALEEAYKALPTDKKPICTELKEMQKELNLLPINAQLWLTLPRVFSRSSNRFEVPMHSRMLINMKPLEYLREYVVISNGRRLLYNLVFKRHNNVEFDERVMLNENVHIALGEMMGHALTDEQFQKFHDLVGWTNEDKLDFKTWCGMCALFERIFAKDFCPQLPSKEIDPCSHVELADFESLSRRLSNITIDERLKNILLTIKEM